MRRLPRFVLAALLVTSAAGSFADSAGSASTAPQPIPALVAAGRAPLPADQLQTIRRVGGSVLRARRGQHDDPELTALNQELQALSQDLDQALTTLLTQAPVLGQAGTVTAANAAFIVSAGPQDSANLVAAAPVPTAPAVATGPDSFGPVRQRLASVDARLQQYRDAARARGGSERSIQADGLAAKVVQLHDELLAAVDGKTLITQSASGGASSPLAALKDRLHTKTRATLSSAAAPGQDAPATDTAPPPTLTGFTRHR
jgi:hypothetical protein